MIKVRLLFLTLPILLGSMSCNPPSTKAQNSTPQLPQRYELIQKFRETRNLLVIYQGENEETTEKWGKWLEEMKKNMPSWFSVDLERADGLSDTSWTQRPVLLMGTPKGHPMLAKIKDKLPISLAGTEISFGEESFSDSLTSLNLNFVPHPLNPSMPINIISGLSDEAIWQKLQGPSITDFSNRLWSNYGYEITLAGERMMVGLFGDNWGYEEEKNWSFVGEKEYSIEGPLFSLKTHGFSLKDSEKEAISQKIEARWTRMLSFFDTTLSPDPFVYHLYADAELMGMQRRKMYQGYAETKKKEAHSIYHPAIKAHNFEPFNQLLIRNIIDKDLPPFLKEGLCHYFTPQWQKEGVFSWGLKLFHADAMLDEEILWDEGRYERSSIYVRGATAGAFVHYLAENNSDLLFHAISQAENATDILRPSYPDFLNYLKTFGKKEAPSPKNNVAFLRGMTLAHEGYNVYDGYASQLANEALGKISNLHGSTVAIVPYSGSRNTSQPIRYRFWEGAGGENSMSVVFAKYHAAQHGMSSLLKPQIYYGGAWPGAVQMKDKEDWKLWHKYYKEWITHYAMIAAIFDFEYLCIGVEFVHATLENPEIWRQLVKDMRQIYSGPITYAANWGDEAEKIAFADELDFLGVNSYYPLSEKEDPTDEDLAQGAEAINQKMRSLYSRISKPIVFTEVGFRSIEKAWQNPHEEPKGRSVDNEAQARCYKAVLEALDGEEWFKGAYWWKWPSYISYRDRQPKSFTPCGKEAEKVLATWYKEWEQLN